MEDNGSSQCKCADGAEERQDCIICNKCLCTGETVKVTTGLAKVRDVSAKNGDNVSNHLGGRNEAVLHKQCRKDYTRRDPIKVCENAKPLRPVRLLRRDDVGFNIKQCCLFCGEKIDLAEKNSQRNLFQIVATFETKEIISKHAVSRNDKLGDLVAARISAAVSDLVAAEVKYHTKCHCQFFKSASEQGSYEAAEARRRGPAHDYEKDKAFQKMCAFLEDSDDGQHDLDFLMEKMLQFSTNDQIYGEKHTRTLLTVRYGAAIIISAKSGRKGYVVTFLGAAHDILTGAWHKEKCNNIEEESRRFVKKSAQLLRSACRTSSDRSSFYPTDAEIRSGGVEQIPELLLLFLEELMKPNSKCDAAPLPHRIAVANDVMAAIRPRSLLPPLHLGTGVMLHRRFGSRYIIDLMSAIGKSSSYKEVMKFEGSLALNAPPSIEKGAFVQFIFDNADHNTRTVTGHGSLHVTAGLIVVTPGSKLQARAAVPRPAKAATTAEIGDKGVLEIKPYFGRKNSGLQKHVMKDVSTTTIDVPTSPEALQLLWLMKPILQTCHGWNGFMAFAHANEKSHEASAFIPVPFIPQQASDPTALHTALLYALETCTDYGQKACVITFDQPLYIKAMDIVSGSPNREMSSIIVRLGGFHLLMSFMGAVGSLMNGSGLSDLWKEVYAKNSVDAMVSGHAYKRALRAHFLTQAALATVIIEKIDLYSFMTTEKLAEIKVIYEKLEDGKHSLESLLSCKYLNELKTIFQSRLRAEAEKSRTGRLWYQYFKQVEIMSKFILAERTADWRLHLDCVRAMLPHLAAAGHLHYAKAGHLYLQEMLQLESKLSLSEYEMFVENGWFSVFRSEKAYGGIWTDMIIEQIVMRSMKVHGGITHGRGQSAATLSRWVNCTPHVLHIIAALEDFSGVTKTSSCQHEELGDAKQRRDESHYMKFKAFLQQHPPFDQQPFDSLVSVSSGLVADNTVNCDNALEIGMKVMQSSVLGKAFPDVHIRRKDKAVNIGATNSSIQVGDERIQVNPTVLFHRIICNVNTKEMLEQCLRHELAPRPTSLFDEISMRTGTKSQLIKVLSKQSPPKEELVAGAHCYIIDGGFLLRRVQWPRPATYAAICNAYCSHVVKHYGNKCWVVFDGYAGGPSTKDVQHVRRASVSARLTVTLDKTTNVARDEFLGNSDNKAQLLPLLATRLQRVGVQVRQAKGDADYTIVQTAVEAARTESRVVLVGEDTDLLVLLAVHAENNNAVSMLMPGRQDCPPRVFDSKELQDALGPLREYLFLLHAFTGCDTTSAPYKRGKHMGFALFKKLEAKKNPLLQTLAVFNCPTATRNAIAAAGEALFVSLYGGKPGSGLDRARYTAYEKMVARKKIDAKFDLAALPPTADAAQQHSYRVYHQVQAWRGVELPATSWGWEEKRGRYVPVTSTLHPAPEYLLKLVFCNCKGTCGGQCECRRAGLLCTSMCGQCSGDGCTNNPSPYDEDDEEEDEEDVDQPQPTSAADEADDAHPEEGVLDNLFATGEGGMATTPVAQRTRRHLADLPLKSCENII